MFAVAAMKIFICTTSEKFYRPGNNYKLFAKKLIKIIIYYNLGFRLTTGPEDILFYYVHLDGNDGILMNPPMNLKRNTPKMKELLQNFRRCCHIIHSILENNIKFKKNAQDSTKQFINKSLVAVKEHGVIFECTSSETDCNKKPMTFTYWIIG